jgi:hypothetical protein
MEEKNNKFTWGDSIIIIKSAPDEFHPGEVASICGFYKIKSPETAEQLFCNVGDWIYTVEFGDGNDIQVAEHYLEKNPGTVHGKELSKYNNYFINGVVLKIKMDISSIEIQVKSSPIHQAISDNFLLSNESRFNGKIIATQIENIIIKNSSHSMGWQQEGNILSFEVSDHVLKLSIEWDRSKTTSFEIKSGQIWWEKQM